MTTKHRTRLERIRRELLRRAPAEPVVIRVVYADDLPAAPNAGERVIQLRWPEDDGELVDAPVIARVNVDIDRV